MILRSRRFPVRSVVAGALLALALAGSPAALAGKSHAVRVLDRDGHVVAVFHSAKCRRHIRAGDFKALTAKTSTGYTLFASIDEFTGFHNYQLVNGANADPYVVIGGPGDIRYSNLFRPPFPSPGFGQIRFSNHHKLMGIGYSPAYSRDGSDAVTFTGVLKCHYPRR